MGNTGAGPRWLAEARHESAFDIGKPQLRPPRCDTRVTPEEKRRFLARRSAHSKKISRLSPASQMDLNDVQSPTATSTSRHSAAEAALRRYHKLEIFENDYVAGHCYFQALGVSNQFTRGVGTMFNAKLLRTSYAEFYGGSMARFWPLRTKLNAYDRDQRNERDSLLSNKKSSHLNHYMNGVRWVPSCESTSCSQSNCTRYIDLSSWHTYTRLHMV